MSELELTVVGGGAAGTAAAWVAARGGARVKLLVQRVGATELSSGALDLEPWQQAHSLALDQDVYEFVDALGAWSVTKRWRRVATTQGVVRPARGIDAALLDLEPLSGAHVAVVDVDHDGFDGQLLARALQASDWAEATGTHFSAVRVGVMREASERYLVDHDLAALHDDPERLAWLGQQLRAVGSAYDAWLLGPWLGAARVVAPALREALAKPVGETTSAPGGPAGARFAAQRDRLLAAAGVDVIETRVRVVKATSRGWRVELSPADQRDTVPDRIAADAVVLAAGGIIGGGLRLASASEVTGPEVRTTFRAPVAISVDGRVLDTVSCLHGLDLTQLGTATLERVGIDTEHARVRGQRRLFAAGDCVAGRPRTVLEAVRAGIQAGRAALGNRTASGASH